jgi:hypothetical protein
MPSEQLALSNSRAQHSSMMVWHPRSPQSNCPSPSLSTPSLQARKSVLGGARRQHRDALAAHVALNCRQSSSSQSTSPSRSLSLESVQASSLDS